MKKLMIMLAAVAMTAVVNAAAVAWNSGVIYRASDAVGTTGSAAANKAGLNAVTAYLYALTAEQYTAAQGMDTATLYNTYIGTTATATKNSVGNGQANISQTVGDASGMHYGLVLYVDTTNANLPDGADAFVKASLATADVGGATTVTIAGMATSSVSSSWTAVPEPTSGLLMLVGLAGLALRRRRA